MAEIHCQSRGAIEAGGRALPVAVPGLILAAIVSTVVLLAFHPQVLRGDLVDGDSYIHIVRLRGILADGSWHGGIFARNNAPFGMAIHWTKGYDLILLALAAPLALIVGWNGALAWVAPAVGPVATFALILAGVWAAAPVCRTAEQRLIGIVLALAPKLIYDGSIGDADHHVMVVAAWLLFMGFALRVGLGQGALRDGVLAGLSAAFALWLSVECILGVGLGIALMGLAWVREGGRLRRANLAFAATFVLAVVTLLALDPPHEGWLQPKLERLSILYVAFAVLVALLWAALALGPQRAEAWRARLAVAAAGAALAALCLAVLFPGVLVPEQTLFGAGGNARLWVDETGEMQPSFRTLGGGVLFASGPAIGLAATGVLAWRERQVAAGTAWAMFALMLAPPTALGLRHVRFMIYPEMFAALPIAMLLVRLLPYVDRVAPAPLRLFGRSLAGMVLLAGPIFLAGFLAAATPAADRTIADCAVRPVAAALNDYGFMGGTDLVIMAHPNETPELLYWTGHRTVAGLFHTEVDGLQDIVRFFASRDDATAKAIVARRGIALVMFCTGDGTVSAAADPDGRELFTRLLKGKVPGWLAAQPWPAGTTSDLRLFRVVRAKNETN